MTHFLSTHSNKVLPQTLLSLCLAGSMAIYSNAAAADNVDTQQSRGDYQTKPTTETPQQSSSRQQQAQRDQQQQQDQQQGTAMDQRQSGSEEGADQAESPDAVVSIVTITEVPVIDLEKLIDEEIVNYKGETIGDIQQIITNPDGTVSGLAVSAGGMLGLGETDLFAPADELQVGANGVVWQTPLNHESLESLPQYQLEQYSASE